MNRFFQLACVVVAMASCAKNEVVDVNSVSDPGVIEFSIYEGSSTKAGDVTTSTIDDVGVYGVLNDIQFSIDALKIPNTMVSKDGNDWESSASYYWPIDGTPYDFYAYYPFSGTADVTNLDENGYVPATDLPISDTAIEQVDILAGGKLGAVNGQQVQLTLDHMLAKVDFRVGIESEYTEGALEITIHSITLKGIENEHLGLDLVKKELVYNSATGTSDTYAYNNETESPNLVLKAMTGTGAGNPTVSGTSLSDPLSLSSRFAVGAIANDVTSYAEIDASDDIEAFMLLPQTLTDNGQQLVFEYTMKQAGGYIIGGAVQEDTSITTQTSTFNLNVSNVDEWKAGCQYIYTLKFVGKDDGLTDAHVIEFYVDEYDWTEPEVELPATNTDDGSDA